MAGVALAGLPLRAVARVSGAVEAVRGATHIAIGERHDNPDHHAMQAELVAALQPRGIAFEMIPRAKEVEVNRLRRRGAPVAEIGEALDWAESGWPDWALYAPILEAAPDAYIAGGGLSRDDLSRLYAEGAPGLGPEMTARYGLDEPLDADMQAAMLNEQYEAHCGMLERGRLAPMVAVQRAWDATYAEAWRWAGVRGGGLSILICGNAHARLDRGAPLYLSRAVPLARIASVGQGEEGDDPVAAGLYSASLTAPRPERGDPCERMRAAMQGTE
jgi:uncharacterized iron-regulated protein